MRNNLYEIYTPLFIIGVLAGALIGISCASILAGKNLKNAAIENECGQFHPKTGKFEWITLTNGEEK